MDLEVRWPEKAKEVLSHIYDFNSERSQVVADNILLVNVQVAGSIRYPEQYKLTLHFLIIEE